MVDLPLPRQEAGDVPAPVKKEVRRAEGLAAGSMVAVELAVLDPLRPAVP